MPGNPVISLRQFVILVTLFSLGSAILYVPGVLSIHAKQDAWIAALIGWALGIGIVWIYVALANRYPHLSLVQCSEHVLGPWLGKAAGLLYLFFPFVLAAIVMRDIGDFVTIEMLKFTPIEIIELSFTFILIVGGYYGLETISRIGELMFPMIIFLFLFLVVFVSPQLKIDHAKPVLEHGITPILLSVKTYIGFPFMELSIFLMILPYVKRTSGAKVAQAFIAGTGICGLMLFVITAASILVLGPSLTARETYPSYLLAKKINVGDFLQRIEAFMAGIWFFSIYMKLVLCLLAIALGIAQLCRLKDYRPLLLPLGVIIFVYSLAISPNMAYMVELTGKLWTAFALTFSLLIPLVLLIVGSFRSRN
ncbi:GerAB/ArcD/ProY family transporter [Paenibacillus tyrfis]|uniref:Uncharacterized protein n=1 Tax=Paenibacillus tyrfis TaxID=1501230 RepID=A0A081P1G8_9BACL|nr:endospore germination permease [Paenibacillus tyrfis]KEQ24541.1 hypothetical protein ET33_09720 [Paenibacillus tyrfis]